MTGKEIRLLGMALKALMDAQMYDKVREVVEVMAEKEGGKKYEDKE